MSGTPDAMRVDSKDPPSKPSGPAVHRPAIRLFAGSASRALAVRVAAELQMAVDRCTTERFPDGELSVELGDAVRGHLVLLLQATAPPVNDHLIELLAIADACRRGAAARVVALMPYFGYARSDRRDGHRTPIMARLAADLLQQAGVDDVVTLDVHTPAVEGFFRIAVENLTAVPVLAEAVRSRLAADAVVVAPDLGATRLANGYAAHLGAAVAICHKQRTGASEVRVTRITGEVAGRRCVIVDDMIATGGTVAESVRAVREAGARGPIPVVATHAVFAPGALDRLAAAGVAEVFVTDSVEPAAGVSAAALHPTIVSVAPLVARAMARMIEDTRGQDGL